MKSPSKIGVFSVTSPRRLPGVRLEAAFTALVGKNEPFGVWETDGVTCLFFGAEATLQLRDGQLLRDGKRLPRDTAKTPLEALFAEIGRYRPIGPRRERFSSGIIGYLGYDCVRYLEKIRLPAIAATEPEASFLVFRNALVLPAGDGPARLAVNVFTAGKNKPDLTSAEKRLARLEEKLVASLRVPVRKGKKTARRLRGRAPAKAPASFTAAIGRVREHIREGDIFQCVLSEPFEQPFSGGALELFLTMRRQNPSPYHFALGGPGFTVVGASPEPLVRVSGRHVETHPIAGTRPRGRTVAEDKTLEKRLRRSPKERAEHLMLVDLARNDLGRVCAPGTVRVRDFMRTERFSHVMHLVSLVEGRLADDQGPTDALFSCFPAGTLTGAPKVRAMEIIGALEPTRRGAYGGAMLYHDFDGELDSCITIRSAVLDGKRAIFRAGAGVVADSTALGEYREIFRKSQSVREALGALE